jgi:hypothetical protein
VDEAVKRLSLILAIGLFAAPVRADPADDTDNALEGIFDEKGAGKAGSGKDEAARPEPAPKRERSRGRSRAGKRKATPAPTAPTPAAAAPETPGEEAALEPDDTVRKVVVAAFDEPEELELRGAVLEVLSARTDIEVLALDDIAVVAKRLGTDPVSARGRSLISQELNIYAWIDARVSGRYEVYISLSDRENLQLSTLHLTGKTPGVLAAAIHSGLWQRIGPLLSRQARLLQRVEQQREAARQKIQAIEKDRERQKRLALQREQRRLRLLAAARKETGIKWQAWQQELKRQTELVRERTPAEARE